MVKADWVQMLVDFDPRPLNQFSFWGRQPSQWLPLHCLSDAPPTIAQTQDFVHCIQIVASNMEAKFLTAQAAGIGMTAVL